MNKPKRSSQKELEENRQNGLKSRNSGAGVNHEWTLGGVLNHEWTRMATNQTRIIAVTQASRGRESAGVRVALPLSAASVAAAPVPFRTRLACVCFCSSGFPARDLPFDLFPPRMNLARLIAGCADRNHAWQLATAETLTEPQPAAAGPKNIPPAPVKENSLRSSRPLKIPNADFDENV